MTELNLKNFDLHILANIEKLLFDEKYSDVTNYFMNTYEVINKELENKKYKKILFMIFSQCVNGDLDENYLSDFVINFSKLNFDKKFLFDWNDFLVQNNDNQNYFDHTFILKIEEICINIVTEQSTKYKLICNLITNILNMSYFVNIILEKKEFKNGKDLENTCFLSIFFKSSENIKFLTENIDNVMKSIEPLINNKKNHNKLVELLWLYINYNKSYISENSNKKTSSSTDFNFLIFKILISLIEFYSVDKIENKLIKNNNQIEIDDYSIINLNFYEKIYITTFYSFIVGYNSKIINKNQIMAILFGNLNINDANSANKLINNLPINKLSNFICSYKKVYKKLKSDEILTHILTVVINYNNYENNNKIKNSLITNEICLLLSDIIGGFNGIIQNKHLRADAMDCIIKLIPKFGFAPFGNILENIVNYLGNVDYFKLSVIEYALQHHDNILKNLIMLFDNFSIETINNNLSVNIEKALFHLIKINFDIYKNIDTITDPRYGNINNALKIFCENMLQSIIMANSILINVIEKKLIKNYSNEFERQISLLLVHNFTKYIKENNVIIEKIARPDIAADIIRMTYKLLSEHLTNELIKYTYDIKNIIFENINYYITDEKCKNTIKNYFENYIDSNIEYPNEFLDPITLCLIENPVFVPNNNDPHDRITIITHIRHEPTNPYTSDLLTENMVDEYNNQENIKIKIQEYKCMFEKFKSDNKL
jgi:hypothetical protein